MVSLQEYKDEILKITDENEKRMFTQRHFFHGLPFVFDKREGDYYSFRKRIADNFRVEFYEVMIVGSSKFGFSPLKFTEFTFDSDIDVVLFNERLFEEYFELVSEYEYQRRNQTLILSQDQLRRYHKFIRYLMIGWMRPDLLPQNTNEFGELKKRWDDFFNEISHSKSEVGDYIVKAGLFKSYHYAEKYYRSSIDGITQKLKAI